MILMNTSSMSPLLIQTLLSFIVPAFTTFLTYLVWHKQSVRTDKTASCREAYKSFYLPFITMLYQTQIGECGFAHLKPESREALFQLISGNIQYMESQEVDFIDSLYSHYYYVKYSEGANTPELILTPDRLDEVFDGFTEKALLRAEKLADKLNQPPLGRFVLTIYHDNREGQKKRKEILKQYMDLK